MSRLPYARNFRELTVYKKSRVLAEQIFKVSQGFPKEERYALTDQVRRASRSIGAQIAEAWAKRSYPRHFASKLTDADGEQNETQHWIEVAFDSGYITEAAKEDLIGRCLEIGRMLGAMIKKAGDFSGEPNTMIEETARPYVVGPDHLSTDSSEY